MSSLNNNVFAFLISAQDSLTEKVQELTKAMAILSTGRISSTLAKEVQKLLLI